MEFLLKNKALLLFLLLSSSLSYSQVTLWEENFESPTAIDDLTGNATGLEATSWSATGDTHNNSNRRLDVASVGGSQVMRGRNTDQVETWATAAIDISSYTDVSFSLDAGFAGVESNNTTFDRFTGSYRIDGGGWIDFQSTTVLGVLSSYSITGLSGSTLEIRAQFATNQNSDSEYYYIDNVLVQGTLLSTSCNTISSTPGSAISDFVTLNSNVSGLLPGTITDVNVTLNITHTYDGDLNISLRSPSGTIVNLSDDNGGSGDNYINTVFDEAVGTSITSSSAPFTGTFNPEGNLSDFNGEDPSGNWTLIIYDDFGGDTGTLNRFSIEVCTLSPSTPSVDITDVSIIENAGPAVFTVTHTGTDTSGGFSVNYSITAGSATQGVDYTTGSGLYTGTLTFNGTAGDTEQITVQLTDDFDVEPDETYTIQFTSVTDVLVDITDTATGTIDNNDVAAVLQVANVAVNEDAGSAIFTVNHTGGPRPTAFTLDYAIIAGSATQGVDYTTGSGLYTGTLNFDGTSVDSDQITVLITDDFDVEPNETYTISFNTPSDAQVDITDTATGTINNDDVTAVLQVANVALDEDAGSAIFTVNHTGGARPTAFTVDYSIAAGSATQGVDYTTGSGLYTGTLNFDGTSGDSDQITVLITDDFDIEPDETYTIQFTSVTDPSVDITDIATGTINNEDVQAVIQVNNATIIEDSGSNSFTVTHTGGDRPAAFTVDYTIIAVSASEGIDYTTGSGVYTGTLNFDGTSTDTDQIIVLLTDDIDFENSETFTISFSTTSDVSVNIADTATITIDDNEVIPVNAPLTLFNEFNGYYDYALTGGSLRTSDTNVCTITTTSSNTLTTTVPATAQIERAYLFWAHSGATPDLQVTFEGQTVNASFANQSNFGGPLYSMIGDVTTLVSNIADFTDLSTNTFDFTGLTVDNGEPYCTSTVVLGGWTLMVFYTDDSLPAVSINLYQGFDGQQNNTTNFTLDGFFAIGATGAKTTVLSWEGDVGLANNELLSVTTSSGTTVLSGDGNNNGTTVNNPFNSTLYDNTIAPIVNATTFGLDLDTYDISTLISAGESTVTTNVGVGQDFVMLNAVLLKVPSNLMIGNVFEDLNYGGGSGRDFATSGSTGVEGTRIELYNNLNALQEFTLSSANGEYSFGGMANGDYSVRAVNNTVNSNRGGGTICSTCIPVQTYRRNYTTAGGFTDIVNEIGGADPAGVDGSAGTLTNAQTVSAVTITSEGVVGLDFGFNFNTIVNTNEDGQGSLEQFIVNSNNLDEIGLDIEANGLFNPAAGDDTSIFMIPPTGDALGRTADGNFASGYFNILISSGNPLSSITAANTVIDGRTQTSYSGNTNSGTIGSGGSTVGTSANILPDYNLPEIQVHRNNGDVLRTQGTNVTIRNLSIYGNNNAGIRVDDGSVTISNNLLGVNAQGVNAGNIRDGVEMIDGIVVIDGNYIATNTDTGILINGGTSSTIQNNHIASNGSDACADNITIQSGSGIVIQQNFIENASSLGIDGDDISGSVILLENTITSSGQNGGNCSGNIENAGIRLDGNNSSITNNIIFSNGGAGIVLAGGNTSGNLISQNSIYANGTANAALGIDLDQSDNIGDGITLNDNGDSDNGPNGAINFPVIETVYKSGTNLVVNGWSRPGATIEFFLTDISEGTATLGDNQLGFSTDYGEGQIFLASVVEGSGSDSNTGTSPYTDVDGNTDNTNQFTFTFSVPLATIGDDITATATISNTTSEFSPFSKLKAFTVITNRRITYRVKKN